MCRDTAVLKQYVIYLYGGAFILAIILWMGSKLNRYILNKLWISMLASLIMAGVIAQMLNQKYGHLMATGELIVGFLCTVHGHWRMQTGENITGIMQCIRRTR